MRTDQLLSLVRTRPEAGATRSAWAAREGAPLPLGVTWIEAEQAFNFALYAKHAERVTLLLYRPEDTTSPALTLGLDHREHKTGRVWHCRLSASQLEGMRYYAYMVEGPPPAGRLEWHAFDPEKVLLDPYARAVHFPRGFDQRASVGPGANAGKAPLGLLQAPDGDSEPRPPRPPRHESDALIYELHVGHFTRHPSSGVPRGKRGTFAGVIEKIPYLVELGVTAVELMPVFERDPDDADRWGYMPLSFFAPHGGYSSRPHAARQEFCEMVDALHRAGIEVLLDVVYTHTCEKGADGPTYGYKGIDNSTYYLMTGDPAAPYADFCGTGNTINCNNHAVRKLVLDSMHEWAVLLGVDGFRFDLASVFGRGNDGALRQDAPLVGEIAGHTDLATLRLIAEPWDGGATLLGRAFPGMTWHQWNAAFRDDVRRFVRGDPGCVPTLMRRLYGSDDLFPDDRANAYRPAQSVNYVACHDGFTLYDLVSYDHKHDWANGHENRDGPLDNFSWNCGWEGDEHLPDEVLALRERQARNLLLLALLANGTPMLRAGDELLQTQYGNDNPYNQDDASVWLDWSRRERFAGFHRFAREAIAFRRRHPTVGRSRYWRGDVRWFGVQGEPDLSEESRALAYCLRGASQDDDDLYVMINGWQEPLTFDVQDGAPGDWRRTIDTGRPSPEDIVAADDAPPLLVPQYVVAPRSIVVLVRRRGDGAPPE